ncbi:MAG: hypothetical protein AAF957_05885 [Planctomycetota bacterium]
MRRPLRRTPCAATGALLAAALAQPASAQIQDRPLPERTADTDGDGLPDVLGSCPVVVTAPLFDVGACGPLDGDPANDTAPE